MNAQQDDGFTKLETVAADTTEYVDRDVLPSTLYRYGVAAEGDKGSSAVVTSETNEPVKVVNRAPVAAAQSLSTQENKPVAVTLSGSDPDGDDLTYKVVTAPKNGTLSGTAPDLTYTPTPNYSGQDSFTFTVSDGQATSAAAMVTLSIGNVNDAPVANAQTVSTPEDTPLPIILSGNDSDGDVLTYTIVGGPIKGSLSAIDQATGRVTYTPRANATGVDAFSFKVSDGTLSSAPAVVSINIGDVNDAPVADDQEVSTEEDTPVTVTLTGSDLDGDSLSFAIVEQPSKDSLGSVDQATGKVLYTPNANANGQDSFTFTVSDGELTSAEATVTLNLEPSQE